MTKVTAVFWQSSCHSLSVSQVEQRLLIMWVLTHQFGPQAWELTLQHYHKLMAHGSSHGLVCECVVWACLCVLIVTVSFSFSLSLTLLLSLGDDVIRWIQVHLRQSVSACHCWNWADRFCLCLCFSHLEGKKDKTDIRNHSHVHHTEVMKVEVTLMK